MIVCLYKKNETKKNRKFFILKKIEHRSFFFNIILLRKKIEHRSYEKYRHEKKLRCLIFFNINKFFFVSFFFHFHIKKTYFLYT
jgi:hypothetical protein